MLNTVQNRRATAVVGIAPAIDTLASFNQRNSPVIGPVVTGVENEMVLHRRVLIADDHALLRVGLKALLSAEHADVEVVEASCLQDALEVYQAHADIGLVLLDLNMGDCRGLQGLRQFKERFPKARVAVFSATQDQFVIQQAQALGAVAYIAKSNQPAVISQMILALLRSDSAGGIVGFSGLTHSARYELVAELGPRQLEILDLVLFGCTNQEISVATNLSLGTVKNYVSVVLLALDVKSRSHLISLFR
jgi:DNA-binding NarL/FixJ family response regulator